MRSLRDFALLALPAALVLSGPARADGWGTIKGRVVYGGASVPAPVKADVEKSKDKEFCLKNGPVLLQEWEVNPKNKGVRWVMVWLAKDVDGKADTTAELPVHPSLAEPKTKDVVMDQPCCRFEPHVVGLRVGQNFVGKNSATIQHNINIIGNSVNQKISKNQLLLPGGTMRVDAARLRPYHIPNIIKCDIHPWMSGRVFVFPHPYFAVTDKDGNFEIKNAPAGKFRLVMLHEGGGWVASRQGKVITIEAGKTKDLGEFKAEK